MFPTSNLLVIRSPDIDRAIEFYRALGLVFTRHAHGKGPEHYSADVAGFVFEIYPLTAKSSPTTGVRLGFKITGMDTLVAILTTLGAAIQSPPSNSEWGRRAVVKDLDGHVVELLEV